jgi:hypothetical protein
MLGWPALLARVRSNSFGSSDEQQQEDREGGQDGFSKADY